MSEELFTNVRNLFRQIDTDFSERSPDDGTGAQMAVGLTSPTTVENMTDLLGILRLQLRHHGYLLVPISQEYVI